VRRNLREKERPAGTGQRAVRRVGTLVLVVFVLAGLGGCAWFNKPTMVGSNPEALYRRGYDDYQRGRYKPAIESFQRLKEQYPLSDLAILAELGMADAYFSDEQYADAAVNYTDFVNLHPTNDNLPYALYQLGMCHHKQITTIDRDQTETVKAKKEFETLLARFPRSKFAVMAEKMLLDCNKRLAEQELYVGEFYFKRKKYKAALGRFELIQRNYPNCGIDYQLSFLIGETKRQLAVQEEKDKKDKKDKQEKQEKQDKQVKTDK
jgi:outer membrane protein assembly factor BamD